MVPERTETTKLNEAEKYFSFIYSSLQKITFEPTIDALGAKGHSLRELENIGLPGLPVPPYFIIITDAWRAWKETRAGNISQILQSEIELQITRLEEKSGKKLDSSDFPLFVSVRSGAPKSMPGQLLTILNVGINDETVCALAQYVGPEDAWIAYFELIKNFGVHVFGINEREFDNLKSSFLKGKTTVLKDLTAEKIQNLAKQALDIISNSGYSFPQDPKSQINLATEAVYRSWDTENAQKYREKRNIPHDLGTAVTIEQMVFGNLKSEYSISGSGVLFTKDPAFGQKPVVLFAPNAQGYAVVDVLSTQPPKTIEEHEFPYEIKNTLSLWCEILGARFPRPQEIEFTIEAGNMYILQTRDATLSSPAFFRYLQDKMGQGRLSISEVQRKIDFSQLNTLVEPPLDRDAVKKAKEEGGLLTTGYVINPGIVTSPVVFSIKDTKEAKQPVIFWADTTLSTSDIDRLPDSVTGLIAPMGSPSSHIAIDARHFGYTHNIPIVFGANLPENISKIAIITIDGNTGEIFLGEIPRKKDGTPSPLTPLEVLIARDWARQRIINPWQFVTEETGLNLLNKIAEQALNKAKESNIRSLKAHEYAVFNSLIQEEIRMSYWIVKPDDINNIRYLLEQAFEQTGEFTVRTGHVPKRPGGGPWFRGTEKCDIQKFIQTVLQKYCADSQLYDLIIGAIPKDKMNPDKKIQRLHCAWTIACNPAGDILFQILPYTAHLRDFGPLSLNQLITYSTRYDPDLPNGYKVWKEHIGSVYKEDNYAIKFARNVKDIVAVWWKVYELPKRLAAITQALKLIPVLEGQARFDPEKQALAWIKCFGINTG